MSSDPLFVDVAYGALVRFSLDMGQPRAVCIQRTRTSMTSSTRKGNEVESGKYGINYAVEGTYYTAIFEDFGNIKNKAHNDRDRAIEDATKSSQAKGWTKILHNVKR